MEPWAGGGPRDIPGGGDMEYRSRVLPWAVAEVCCDWGEDIVHCVLVAVNVLAL